MIFPTNNTATIFRVQKNVSNKSQYAVDSVYSDLPVLLAPAGPDVQVSYPNVPAYTLFEVYIYDGSCQIENTDKLVISGADYIVRGLPQHYDAVGIDCMRLTCEKVL